MKRFMVEVQADNTGTWAAGTWAGNNKQFDTAEGARSYARDLHCRWTSVRKWRVVDAPEELNNEEDK